MSSRRSAFERAFVAALFVSIASSTDMQISAVFAQDAPALNAEQVAADAEAAYGPPPPEPKCAPQEGDEIVVCAEEEQDQSQFRVKSSSELDPESEEALDDGLPRAPDLSGPGIFKGKPTVSGLCFVPPCPSDPAYIIDFSELPETPPGSDADLVGRGLAPKGDQSGSTVVDTAPADIPVEETVPEQPD